MGICMLRGWNWNFVKFMSRRIPSCLRQMNLGKKLFCFGFRIHVENPKLETCEAEKIFSILIPVNWIKFFHIYLRFGILADNSIKWRRHVRVDCDSKSKSLFVFLLLDATPTSPVLTSPPYHTKSNGLHPCKVTNF